jgi:prepilin-type N-terminal cleavage/methylation domain-containing protein
MLKRLKSAYDNDTGVLSMKRQHGFTLVEIAIVLVIIGLLLGGILKGQELITNAKVKNAVNTFNGTSAAIYAYQDRYKYLPGDDPTATTRWTGSRNGNGDGVIGGNWNSGNVNDESRRLWQDLRFAGMITGSATPANQGTLRPTTSFGGAEGVQTLAYYAGMSAGVNICVQTVGGSFAALVDTQLDDGYAASGTMRGNSSNTANVAYTPNTNYNLCITM